MEITNLGFFRKILPFLNYATWVKIIENLGDDWTKLDEKTLVFLASGEFLFDNLGDKQEDYSPMVMQFGRAIENELAVKLFKPFKQDLDTKLLEDADYQLKVLKSQVQKNKKNKFSKEQKHSVTKLYEDSKPQSLISMLNYFFSLGKMINALEVQSESIFLDIRLFKNFDVFIENRIKDKNLVLAKGFLDTLRGIAATRNKAGHTEIIEYKNSTNVKKEVNKTIKIWISAF